MSYLSKQTKLKYLQQLNNAMVSGYHAYLKGIFKLSSLMKAIFVQCLLCSMLYDHGSTTVCEASVPHSVQSVTQNS